MKKTIRVKTTDFSDISISAFADKMNEVIQAIFQHTVAFTNVPFTQTVLNDALADLNNKIGLAANGGSRDARINRDQQYETCLSMMYTLAAYVLNVAYQEESEDDQRDIILLAKFTPTRRGGKIGPILAPQNVRSRSLSQAVEVEFDRVHGANSYILFWTTGFPTGQSVWNRIESTRSKILIPDLAAGQVVSFKVCGLGAAGLGQPSDYGFEVAKV